MYVATSATSLYMPASSPSHNFRGFSQNGAKPGDQIMPLMLTRCPGFASFWEKHRKLWDGEEAGIYNDVAEVATYIVNCYASGNTGPIVAAFETIEELLVTGDAETRAAASIGFLE